MEIVIAIIGIAIAIVIGIFSIVIPIYYSKKLKVLILKPDDAKRIEKSINLYFEKIPDEQRIPPDHLIKSLKLPSSALSVKDFKVKVASGYRIVHLPIVAEIQSEIVGFLKAIYVKDMSYVFIAYLVSKNFNQFDSIRITSVLLNEFYDCIKKLNQIDSIIYEIVKEENKKHLAKERLFKHTARTKEFKVKLVDAPYIIPEVCSFDEGDCEIYDSNLFILQLKNNASSISKTEYLKVINSIYNNIYTQSYKDSEPELVEKHREFVELIISDISKKLCDKISLI